LAVHLIVAVNHKY